MEVGVSDNHYDELSVEAEKTETKDMLPVMKFAELNK